MDIRQRLGQAISACEQFSFRRYFVQMINQRLAVLESEYHASYEENRNKDYSGVFESLQNITDSLTVLRNLPNFDQYGKNMQFWNSYRFISEKFNEFVLKLQRCGFVYTCGINKGILDLLMVPETGVSKITFTKLDMMHDALKDAVKKWGLKTQLKSEIALLFWYTEIQSNTSKIEQKTLNTPLELLSLTSLQQSLDSFSMKLEGLRFDVNSLESLLAEKTVLNSTANLLSKYKEGYIGVEYIETVMSMVYTNPSLKYSIFTRDKLVETMAASTFGLESIASSSEPLVLQVIDCSMQLANVKSDELIRITQKSIRIGDHQEQPLKQPGVVYFGRQSSKNGPNNNDISFPPQQNRVSRQQFQIVCQSMNYYSIICTSPSNPTSLKISDHPYELQRHMVFKLGDYKFLVNDLFSEGASQPINPSLIDCSQCLGSNSASTLIRLNLNMDQELNNYYEGNQTFQNIDLLEKSQDTRLNPQVLDNSELPYEDEDGFNIKASEPTIKLKSTTLQKHGQQQKPFIELTCIQGEYNPMKLFHEEVNDHGTQILTFGRDQRNKFYLPDKEISRFHCQIVYDAQKRWKICERYIPDQTNLSSGGTYIQLQSFEQSKNEQYSNPCPLQKGMLIHSEGATFKVL